MDFFSRMFSSMFRSSANRFKDRAVAQVRRNTVGEVQASLWDADTERICAENGIMIL